MFNRCVCSCVSLLSFSCNSLIAGQSPALSAVWLFSLDSLDSHSSGAVQWISPCLANTSCLVSVNLEHYRGPVSTPHSWFFSQSVFNLPHSWLVTSMVRCFPVHTVADILSALQQSVCSGIPPAAVLLVRSYNSGTLQVALTAVSPGS